MLDAIVKYGFLLAMAVWCGVLAWMNTQDSKWRKRK